MSLTYPHPESLGLVQTVGRREDVELIQDGAPTEALIVVIIDKQSLRPEQSVCKPPTICTRAVPSCLGRVGSLQGLREPFLRDLHLTTALHVCWTTPRSCPFCLSASCLSLSATAGKRARHFSLLPLASPATPCSIHASGPALPSRHSECSPVPTL